jgi:hypothetical protein
VNELLEQKACFYVCGDAANMAREVNVVLGQVIAEQRGLPEAKGEEIVKMMRTSNLYQVCYLLRRDSRLRLVWFLCPRQSGSPFGPFTHTDANRPLL